MDSVKGTRLEGYVFMFFDAFVCTSLVITMIRNWSFFTAGIFQFLLLIILFVLALFFLMLTVYGISLFEMTVEYEQKFARFKQKMSKLGYIDSSPVIVYGEGVEHAEPFSKQFTYTFKGVKHTFPTNRIVDTKFPSELRFRLFDHKLTNSILVYDRLQDSWLIFY